jgi:hypothetical protein
MDGWDNSVDGGGTSVAVSIAMTWELHIDDATPSHAGPA